ncbi:hypothetical protein Zmor_009274 [Zophobas morio]|uniref:Uncharacterized protein n=1 Tax=Zophobas morio TaxID=2755281 RepID=A0AA38MIJ4_9CUCU|nr:hypothetical protein Zmor_009274 [Zophobas morio]
MATKIMKYLFTSKLVNSRLQSIFAVPKTKLTNFSRCEINNKLHTNRCNFSTNDVLCGSGGHAETTSTTQGLSKLQAQELVLRLNGEERNILISALQEYESKLVKDEYEGQLAASRWRSKFGRPSKLPRLGDVDPTGSYCPVPEDWLMKKYGTQRCFFTD